MQIDAHIRTAAGLMAIGLALATGCSMRVTGTVRDATSGAPIGGAVLTAEDGRNRMTVTDPYGRFALKTRWAPSTLVVSAPGYTTATVAVPETTRYPIVTVDLTRAFDVGDAAPAGGAPVAGAPLVERIDESQAGSPDTATKLRNLQQLYDRGLISEAEYQRTRRRIVDGL